MPVRCEVFLFFDDPDDPSIRHAKSLEDYAQSKKMAGAALSVHRMDTSWWEKAKARSRFYQRQDAWMNNSLEPVGKVKKLLGSTCSIMFRKNKVQQFELKLAFFQSPLACGERITTNQQSGKHVALISKCERLLQPLLESLKYVTR